MDNRKTISLYLLQSEAKGIKQKILSGQFNATQLSMIAMAIREVLEKHESKKEGEG